MPTRRTFCQLAAATLLARPALPQTRLNLAQIDHNRIQTASKTALDRKPIPIKDLNTQAFLDATLDLPALAAANYLAETPILKAIAGLHLSNLFTGPNALPTTIPDIETIALLAPLAETAVAIPFLNLMPDYLATFTPWFETLLTTLAEDRTALLARDSKDHAASSWLLLVAAFARLLKKDQLLSDSLHRFKTQAVRAQINANGFFSHELPTPNPFRNSLFNLDLLAGVCVLLSTRFDSLWDHELQDGPGMRAAISRHAPYIAAPKTWPYPVDATHFRDLPARRPALLFAARAYSQPDYATLWQTLPPDPISPEILRAFPIRQPILWQSQPRLSS